MDDSVIDYSPTDWREKYNEVADMLEQTRSELDEFHVASKELEGELEAELQRTERAQKDLMVKVAQAEGERDDWKTKFMSLQTTHNTTTTSLQRELDHLRRDHQQLKVQFRELEMGNDDLERNERAVSSSLADVETKYSAVLEEKILLEHELLDKAHLEEECQRLKDELRDATEEARILHDQLEAAKSAVSSPTEPPSSPLASQEDLLKTPPPGDLLLSELGPSTESLPSVLQATPKAARPTPIRTLVSPSRMPIPKSNGIPRVTTVPALRTPTVRPSPGLRSPSIASSTTSNSSTGIISKHKGVQMVSDLRARVKNMQVMTTHVPRFPMRMKSVMGKTNGNLATSTYAGTNSSVNSNRSVQAKGTWDSFGNNIRRSVDSKKSTENDEKKKDDSGWVLIKEESPSPRKAKLSEEAKLRERRRASSPLTPHFKPSASTAAPHRSGISPKPLALAQSTINTGLRRPGSRLSGGSSLSSATTSSIPTPTSRPATPTMLPIPTSSAQLKRSMGPLTAQAKRSSFGSRSVAEPPSSKRERPVTMPPPLPTNRLNFEADAKALPSIPSTVTLRTANRLPKSSSGALSKSRIGRPSGGSAGGASRRSSMDEAARPTSATSRARSSSSAALTVDGLADGEYDETETF